MPTRTLLLPLALVLAACGDDAAEPDDGPGPPREGPPGVLSRTAPGPHDAATADRRAPRVSLIRLAEGVRVEVEVDAAAGPEWVRIHDAAGRLVKELPGGGGEVVVSEERARRLRVTVRYEDGETWAAGAGL